MIAINGSKDPNVKTSKKYFINPTKKKRKIKNPVLYLKSF